LDGAEEPTLGTQYVAFNPMQIKSVFNETPLQSGAKFQRTAMGEEIPRSQVAFDDMPVLKRAAIAHGYTDVNEWRIAQPRAFADAVKKTVNSPPQLPLFQRQQPITGARFNLPGETRLDVTQRLLQDRENRIKRVQEAVVEGGGTLGVASDTYLAAERYPKVTAYKLERFREKTVQPLLERIGKAGVETSDIALYMYAKHAPERNAWIAQINPTMPDGGSGMTNAEAAQVLATFAADPQLPQIQQFAAELNAIQKRTQQVMLNAGMITPAVLAAWNTRSANYVPLKGFEKIDELGDRSPGTGVGFDVRGPESRRALGRSSKAGQIVENILFDHQKALVRAEKNKVGKVLLNFVLSNKDPELWQVDKIEPMAQFYKSGGVNIHGLLNGEVRYQNKVVQNPNDTIVVKHYGKEYSIWIKDPLLLQSLKGKGGLMDMGSQEVVKLERIWNSANRFLAKMWTALNPVFTTINFTRDFLTGMIHAANLGGVKYASNVAADIPAMMKGIWDVELRGDETSANAQWYMQYQQDGGKTGFYMFGDMDERLREIQKMVEAARTQTGVKGAVNAGIKAIQKIEDVIMDVNGVIENAIRVAAYKAHIEANGGVNASAATRAEAASIAANLTVNFNRKGEMTPKLASLFLFFNPAVQGTTRIVQAAKNNPKEFSAVVGSMAALGIILGMLAAEDKDDEGVPYWDRIPDYEKQRSLIVMTGGGDRITVPLPYGYGFFLNLGYGIADMWRGRPLEAVGLGQAKSLAQHFNPLGSSEEPVMMLTPTLVDPFVEMYANKRATGQPLMPDEQSLTGMPVPDSERYWGSTRGTAVQQFTTWLNEFTGGTKVTPGAIDVSPETIKNFIRYYGGGLG
ncbi:MAG: hypothetical protein RL375_1372, partial [Pseudomonadota bacterium]